MTGTNSLFQKLSSKFSNPDPYAGMTQRQIDALKNEAEKEAQKKVDEKRYSLTLLVLLFESKYSRIDQVKFLEDSLLKI